MHHNLLVDLIFIKKIFAKSNQELKLSNRRVKVTQNENGKMSDYSFKAGLVFQDYGIKQNKWISLYCSFTRCYNSLTEHKL